MKCLINCLHYCQSQRVVGLSNEQIQILFNKENDDDLKSCLVRTPKSCLGKTAKCFAYFLSCGVVYLVKSFREDKILAKHRIVTETFGPNYLSRSRAAPSLQSIHL